MHCSKTVRRLGRGALLVVVMLATGDRTIAAEQSPASTSPFGPVTCEGYYPKHLQGVCTDGQQSLFWCFTTELVKTDAHGRRLAQAAVANHHGDLCYHAGKLYVAVNLGKFNQPAGAADSWVYVYDPADLRELSRHAVPQVVHGAGGMAWDGRRFIIIGGLPLGVEVNYAYEYDAELNFVRQHEIAGGYTLMGIQTAAFHGDTWWFGCYGVPKVLLKTDAQFRPLGRYLFDAAFGIIPCDDGCFLIARDHEQKGRGRWAELVLAAPDAAAGLVVRP